MITDLRFVLNEGSHIEDDVISSIIESSGDRDDHKVFSVDINASKRVFMQGFGTGRKSRCNSTSDISQENNQAFI